MSERYCEEDIFRILRLISSGGDLSQRDLSRHLDISLGKANYILKALVMKGLVKVDDFASEEKKLKKVRYILTREGVEKKAHLTYYFLKRKKKEYLELKREAKESGTREHLS
jgi:EPS-associated MarR family transcriptional regulator